YGLKTDKVQVRSQPLSARIGGALQDRMPVRTTARRSSQMLIVDSQIHLWENARMSPHHRQVPTYAVHDALQEMGAAGVDAAVLHPPSTLGEKVNAQAVDA